jgi:hypothetical protein
VDDDADDAGSRRWGSYRLPFSNLSTIYNDESIGD